MVDVAYHQSAEDRVGTSEQPVLCVDLDGSLLLVDTLHESILRAARTSPTALLKSALRVFRGKAQFKRSIAQASGLGVSYLPYNEQFLAFLEREHASGRRIVLVTAADQSIADAIATRFQIFETAIGSDGRTNLSGDGKLAAIRERYGDNFVYAGNSADDLPVWRAAKGAILVGDGVRFAKQVARTTVVEAQFPAVTQKMAWLKALRPHQWAKNLLVFVPFFLAGRLVEPGDLPRCIAGFVILCLLASTGYIINDLLDLEADRQHPSKRRRPFASGVVPVKAGVAGAAVLTVASLTGAFLMKVEFAVIALAYLIGTLTYSFVLKRIALLDVMTLAGLYTLRIRAGIALVGSAYSYWIITFSIFIFISLALLKRYAEFVDVRLDEKALKLRGYDRIDAPIVLGFGIACSVAAPMLFVLYLVEERFPAKVYTSPERLWLVTPVLLLWLMHMWREAVRGLVREDPVIFALKDKTSLALGTIAAILVTSSW